MATFNTALSGSEAEQRPALVALSDDLSATINRMIDPVEALEQAASRLLGPLPAEEPLKGPGVQTSSHLGVLGLHIERLLHLETRIAAVAQRLNAAI